MIEKLRRIAAGVRPGAGATTRLARAAEGEVVKVGRSSSVAGRLGRNRHIIPRGLPSLCAAQLRQAHDREVFPATYAAGPRGSYGDLPAPLRAWVDRQLGAPVVEVHDRQGGFSPGVAATVGSREGRSLFVKAVRASINSEALRLHHRERELATRLPPLDSVVGPVGWADLDVAGDHWAITAFPALPGSPPAHPWRGRDLQLTLDALDRLAADLTPCPASGVPTIERLTSFLTGWRRIADDSGDPWHRHPWVGPRLEPLVTGEQSLHSQLAGDTLTHGDLRADNLLLSGEQVWFVDWAHAQCAARWVDAALLIGDVVGSRADRHDGGEIDVVRVVATHPAFRDGGPTLVWWTTAALAAALHDLSRRDPPAGLPTLRPWQGATAGTLLRWCARTSISGL